MMLHAVLEGTIFMLLRVVAVMLITPIFIIPAVIVAILAGWVSQMYMRAQLSVKREMSNARAPVLGHFGSAIAGLGAWCTPPDPLRRLTGIHTVSFDPCIRCTGDVQSRVLHPYGQVQPCRVCIRCALPVRDRRADIIYPCSH